MTLRAVVFDAYGTLFDVYSVARTAEQFFPGRGDALSRLWRERQIDYSRLRTLSNRYQPFSAVTEHALAYSLASLQLSDPNGAATAALLDCYRKLDIFPENTAVLSALRESGVSLGILSNGDQEMLHAVIQHNHVGQYFNQVLSCDRVKRFKTDPRTYQLAQDAFECTGEELLFVSSNCWDACGAAWFGFSTFWINRRGEPVEVLDAELGGQASTMTPLLEHISRFKP